jgi:hypothetical protein
MLSTVKAAAAFNKMSSSSSSRNLVVMTPSVPTRSCTCWLNQSTLNKEYSTKAPCNHTEACRMEWECLSKCLVKSIHRLVLWLTQWMLSIVNSRFISYWHNVNANSDRFSNSF